MLPKDHHELMTNVLDQIQKSSSLPIAPTALSEFERGNICTFKEQFPNLNEFKFAKLMAAATAHGQLSTLAATLKDPNATSIELLPFFWAGKVVRAMTMGMKDPDPVPDPPCTEDAEPAEGETPPPVPAGPYCSWPPVP